MSLRSTDMNNFKTKVSQQNLIFMVNIHLQQNLHHDIYNSYMTDREYQHE